MTSALPALVFIFAMMLDMHRKRIVAGILLIIAFALVFALLWYMKTHIRLVTKEERRTVVVSELGKALEHYYDEYGRYPVVDSNEALMRELSAKKYFENDVRIDVVRYVPINYGQTYELQ
ncbi:MAG: hypothetical protein RLZZ234_620 [Candidatus Parcubacteria bacterium]|jgi:hypothetical protein